MTSKRTQTEYQLPDGPLVAWYGDDFTGASAVMEVLQFAGLSATLFLDLPTEEQLKQFSGLRAIGIASTARAHNPAWMDQHLPAAFAALGQLGAPLIHYKVCTTLDSSPTVGSIGRAMDIGAKVFTPGCIPFSVAAPQMRRYQCFGHLFASMGEDVHRIDRHPAMAQHPVTPIDESDVIQHLGRQTRMPMQLINLEALSDPDLSLSQYQTSANTPDAVVFDCMGDFDEQQIGRLLWENRASNRFVVGSQGIEYALVRYWQSCGALASAAAPQSLGKASPMAVVSGSVSSTTAAQIAWSKANGFECVPFNNACVLGDQRELDAHIEQLVGRARKAFSEGRDILIYTAAGPGDPAVTAFKSAAANAGVEETLANQLIGQSLGKTLRTIVTETRLKRAVISGGDTSGFATQQMDVYALTALAPTIPGAAIFKAHAFGPIDGLELALKGGQMGSEDYFGWVRDGGGERH